MVPKPFPLEAPIRPEGRQIGRKPAIDGLERQVLTSRQHTLLLADRHVGKTSMAWAVLDRLRASPEEGWALEVNLAHGPVTSASALGARLADQARAAAIGVRPAGGRLLGGIKKAAGVLGGTAVGAAAKQLGLAEGADVNVVAAAIDEALAGTDDGGGADLREVLAAIGAAAIAADRPAVVFLDEVQRLGTHWLDAEDSLRAQAALAEVMDQPEGHTVFLLAGSEESAVAELFASGRPLHRDGMIYPVGEISTEDWLHGLSERFTEVELEIEADRIMQVLAASGGHPQKTMRVCAHIHQLADPEGFAVSEVLVDQAIEVARRHPSWTA